MLKAKEYSSLEELFENARQEGFLFDLGEGLVGHYEGTYERGPEQRFIFRPLKNGQYYEVRARLGDDFTVCISDSETLHRLAQQFLTRKEGA